MLSIENCDLDYPHTEARATPFMTGRGTPTIEPRRKGFTIVELLVVMGIIALLIGILIPVISRAQAASRSVTCISTLRNIGHCFYLYAQDNKGTYPDPGSVGYSWEQLLQPYFHGDFRCPSDEELFPTVGSSYDWRDTPDAATTLAGVPMAAVKRPNLVLAFESLPGWHAKGKMNAVLVDGSAQTMDEETCLADLDSSIDPSLPPNFKRRAR
jgi:prepilin-type N-terminal cleavage/methylation domain-containing protein